MSDSVCCWGGGDCRTVVLPAEIGRARDRDGEELGRFTPDCNVPNGSLDAALGDKNTDLRPSPLHKPLLVQLPLFVHAVYSSLVQPCTARFLFESLEQKFKLRHSTVMLSVVTLQYKL